MLMRFNRIKMIYTLNLMQILSKNSRKKNLIIKIKK
uniref:Uncharacterized protein n=1 Tax=Myoviridae sp. ctCo31 TaxID=2825053 RepID=A0A8S5UM83_9CAUD|nr:MAG TPA: hypothetical protein [Myoviridae sp. ctCo31]